MALTKKKDDQKSNKSDKMHTFPELVAGPTTGEISVDVAVDTVPLDEDDLAVVEKLTEGDDSPCWVAMEILEGPGSHGDYQASAIKAVVEQVNEQEPMGFLGHQKQEDLPYEFPDPTTHWFAAEFEEADNDNGRSKAIVYGLVDQAFPNLRRWIRANRIKEISIYGEPVYESGTRDVINYNLYSIDWAPRGRSGMETSLLWSSEMDDPRGEQDGDEGMDTWTKEDAQEWLEDNDYSYGDTAYDKMVNWHAFTQEDPDEFEEFRTEEEPFGFDAEDGVHVIYGLDEDENTTVQSIRFYHGEGDAGEDDDDDEDGESGEMDGSYNELIDFMRQAVREYFGEEDTYIYLHRLYEDHAIVEYNNEGSSGYWWVDYELSEENGQVEVAFGDPVEVVEERQYVKVEEEEDQGLIESLNQEERSDVMTIAEMLAEIRAAIAKGEYSREDTLNELGITGEQALALLDDDRLEQLENAAEIGTKLIKALGFSTEDTVDDLVSTAGEMFDVYSMVADAENPVEFTSEMCDVYNQLQDTSGETKDVNEFTGELLTSYTEKLKETNGEVINNVVQDKVKGEQSQKLIKRLLNVPEDADKETITGEVEDLLEDEEVKGMLSKLYTDNAPSGETKKKKSGKGFKSEKTTKVKA